MSSMLYIHIPYCKGKCIYCDFYSRGNPDWSKYLKAVASELSERIGELRSDSLSSIYIGGGTPSLIPAKDFVGFMEEINRILHSANISLEPNMEFTIEVNPEDVEEERLSAWVYSGVNRVSMGVQSMSDRILNFLNRRHNAKKVEKAVDSIRRYVNNISLDIIYGIPTQTLDELRETVEKMIAIAPEHISAYGLQYEPQTVLYNMREKRLITELPEEVYLEMENELIGRLREAGYHRYEISNYSKPGKESRHNMGYWTGLPYLGLGPSASSYDGERVRRTNIPDLKSYLQGSTEFERETLSVEELREEALMVGLRRSQGIDLNHFRERFGKRAVEDLRHYSEKWVSDGKMVYNNENLCLTQEGMQISDKIILDLV